MRIYIIGNYPLLDTTSMYLYAKLLKKIIKKHGHQVEIINPALVLNTHKFTNKKLIKWLGYIDNYIFFGIKLFFKINKRDIVHICDQANSILLPFIRSKNLIITCHDVVNIKNLLNKNLNKLSFTGAIYQRLILHFIKNFKKIICVSKSTQLDLIKISNINKHYTKVIYNTLNHRYYPMRKKRRSKILLKYKIDFKFLLHVGGNNWYKNKITLIKIFSRFNKIKGNNNIKLILAGKKITNEMQELINKLNLNNMVINLIKPKKETLCALYSDSIALIFPSITEGFGWPIIEAQACGCPVFTSNFKPMTEIGNNSVFYLKPNKKNQSSITIHKNIKKKESIIKKGFVNLNRFRYSLISKQYIDYYKNLISKDF